MHTGKSLFIWKPQNYRLYYYNIQFKLIFFKITIDKKIYWGFVREFITLHEQEQIRV